jgi:hypothetical protein
MELDWAKRKGDQSVLMKRLYKLIPCRNRKDHPLNNHRHGNLKMAFCCLKNINFPACARTDSAGLVLLGIPDSNWPMFRAWSCTACNLHKYVCSRALQR